MQTAPYCKQVCMCIVVLYSKQVNISLYSICFFAHMEMTKNICICSPNTRRIFVRVTENTETFDNWIF